jgi:hypothetical protein
MVRPRHAPLSRLCLVALIALALMLNGVSRVLAQVEDGDTGNSIVIAGTIITLCHFGKDDAGSKARFGHSCDQCALRLAPILPQTGVDFGSFRFPHNLVLHPLPPISVARLLDRTLAWPRGPPTA